MYQKRSAALSSYIITPKELSDALSQNASTTISSSPRIVPLCASWFLPNDPQSRTGQQVFKEQRIPMARFFELDAVKDHDSPYPHMLPTAEGFAKAMEDLGIRKDDEVVVYDSKELGLFSAPRVGWTFKVFGHPSVHLLNNFRLWVEQGFPTESGDTRALAGEKTKYPVPSVNPDMVVKYAEVKDIATNHGKEESDGIQILDARSKGRWAGTDPEPRPGLPSGHIPGSLNVPVSELLNPQTGALLDGAELRKIFKSKGVEPDKPIISSCGTGVTAAVLDAALAEAGFGRAEDRRIYDGSWTEWAQRIAPALIMETPICITDAATLVDRIHQIKSWIYNGQLRLIVPSSSMPARQSLPIASILMWMAAVQNVDQIYQKSIEPKPLVKEITKPKISRKPTKKEYPAFDMNPRIAKAFLERVRAGKDYETGHLGRPIYEDEEKHDAVHFPPANEQYTPWKHIEEYEETIESPIDGQRSWADKLRKKPALANGTVENKSPKGPVKPKLVAKSGAENSPWKVQRNSPTISATEVPAMLRPMMSCALWRIHESIHRNDDNQLFILTDQQNIKDVGEKLNIVVRSAKQLGEYIGRKYDNVDLDVYGDLEREFGVQPIKERPQINASAQALNTELTDGFLRGSGPHLGNEESEDGLKPLGESLMAESSLRLCTDCIADNNRIEAVQHDGQVRATPLPVTLGPPSDLVKEDNPQARMNVSRDGEKAINEDEKKDQSALTLVKDTAVEKPQGNVPSSPNSTNTQLQPPANKTWFRSFADALTGNAAKKALPVPIGHTTNEPEEGRAPIKLPASPPKPSKETVASRNASEELPDSDEEVVVFQPKRLSAQKKPPQRKSRPSTPNHESVQPNARTHAVPRPLANTPKAIKSMASHTQLKPSNGPLPVIDPDAFGRSFAINTNPHPRGGSSRSMRSHHSPQSSVKNAVFDPSHPVSRPNSSHRQSRASADCESPTASPQQAPMMLSNVNEAVQRAQPAQMPIGTGRPSLGPTADLRTQMINAPVFQPSSASNPVILPMDEHNPSSVQLPTGSAKQAPIGSGRPRSKNPPQPATAAPVSVLAPPSGPSLQDSITVRNLNPRTPASLRRQDPDFIRNNRTGSPRYPSPQQSNSDAAKRPYAQTPPPGPRHNRHAHGPSEGSLPRPRGGGGPRLAKPSLFEPTLDHTRAYQPDTFEPRKSAVDEVQYVLKSGSTREQARGKGKLWVG
ncbi:MAG: hypothetical protein Q9163_002345 [Psora crenata]